MNRHAVKFYSDERRLIIGTSRFLAEGLDRGERVLVIAAADHNAAFQREMNGNGMDIAGALEEGRILFRDAQEALAQFMVNGRPGRDRFERTVGELVRKLRAQAGSSRLRAYGEMVDVLWNSGRSAAAIRLEQYWNELLEAQGFDLLCAYQIDLFGKEFQPGVLDTVLRAHTHVVPAPENGALSGAVGAAMDEVLGTRTAGLKTSGPDLPAGASVGPSWAEMPDAEAKVLWLRDNLPEYVDEILVRARRHYQAALTGAEGD